MTAGEAATARRGSLAAFGAVWAAQLVSVIGSSLSGFALGVWAYQTTGSVTQFALIFTANVLPGVLIAPFAGAVVDRRDRKAMLILGDCGAAVATAAVAVLLTVDRLEVWHLYVATAVGASFTFLHRTAFYALVPTLVPKRHLGRANGLLQLGQAVAIAAPVLAGALLVLVGLRGVLLVDLGSFAVALATVLAVTLPKGPGDGAEDALPEPPSRLRDDLAYGWRYFGSHRGLLLLVLFSAAYDLLFAFAAVLVRPLILSFASPATLGLLEFAGGAGMIAGSLVMTAWGGTRRQLSGALLFTGLGGVALTLHSLSASPWLLAVVAPLFLFTMPIVNGSVYTVLQTTVPDRSLGRVSAAAQMIWQTALPIGALAAGPLADRVFEPAMRPDGALAGTVGAVIGTGPGRGIALIFAVTGVALVALAVIGRLTPRLWRLEDTAPTSTVDPPAETRPSGTDAAGTEPAAAQPSEAR